MFVTSTLSSVFPAEVLPESGVVWAFPALDLFPSESGGLEVGVDLTLFLRRSSVRTSFFIRSRLFIRCIHCIHSLFVYPFLSLMRGILRVRARVFSWLHSFRVVRCIGR